MKKQNKQNVVIVAAAITVIAVSAAVTAVFSLGLFQPGSSGSSGYKNVTFTDASLSCEARVQKDFGRNLKQVVVDNHSSRHESQLSVYKIFLMAYAEEKKQSIEFYVTCFVSSRSGGIVKYEALENVEPPTGEALRQGADKFIEWPR